MDGRADQYALACTVFELLTGQTPFRRDEAAAVIWAQMTEPPPSLTSQRAGLPPAVDGVLAKALAKRPEIRYATCREFAEALRAALGLTLYDPTPRRSLRPTTCKPSQASRRRRHGAAGWAEREADQPKTPTSQLSGSPPMTAVSSAVTAPGIAALDVGAMRSDLDGRDRRADRIIRDVS